MGERRVRTGDTSNPAPVAAFQRVRQKSCNLADDELERLRALFKHAHEHEKKGVFRKLLTRIKRRFAPPMPQPEPKSAKKDEAA
jgi:hypothetical protein